MSVNLSFSVSPLNQRSSFLDNRRHAGSQMGIHFKKAAFQMGLYHPDKAALTRSTQQLIITTESLEIERQIQIKANQWYKGAFTENWDSAYLSAQSEKDFFKNLKNNPQTYREAFLRAVSAAIEEAKYLKKGPWNANTICGGPLSNLVLKLHLSTKNNEGAMDILSDAIKIFIKNLDELMKINPRVLCLYYTEEFIDVLKRVKQLTPDITQEAQRELEKALLTMRPRQSINHRSFLFTMVGFFGTEEQKITFLEKGRFNLKKEEYWSNKDSMDFSYVFTGIRAGWPFRLLYKYWEKEMKKSLKNLRSLDFDSLLFDHSESEMIEFFRVNKPEMFRGIWSGYREGVLEKNPRCFDLMPSYEIPNYEQKSAAIFFLAMDSLANNTRTLPNEERVQQLSEREGKAYRFWKLGKQLPTDLQELLSVITASQLKATFTHSKARDWAKLYLQDRVDSP